MAKLIQSVRGMNDILPEQSHAWQYLENTVARVTQQFGYTQIRMPIVEPTALFKRSIGEVTDIVEKEMYTFEDRNGDSLTLRPEGTAGCVRACLQHGLLHNQQQRLWYSGPMFRHERPQKGRYRQFQQIGVEVFGLASADTDAELLLMTWQLWKELGLSGSVQLQINSIGSAQCRANYKQALVDYLTPYKEQLDEDSQRRLDTNPLRILDSKSPSTQEILVQAPSVVDFLNEESSEHFALLQKLLTQLSIPFTVNPTLVRGLDYYGKTVFEWVTDELGAQGTVCAGGRYDGLVEQLGGRATPAVGFAMGVERLLLLLEHLGKVPPVKAPLVYCVVSASEYAGTAMLMASELRSAFGCDVVVHCGGGSLKSQMKKADKSAAQYALILAENEIASATFSIKKLQL